MIAFLALLVALVWRGYVFTVLWGWFVMKQFQMQALPLGVALGLMLMLSLLQKLNLDKKDKPSEGEKVLAAFLVPALALGMAWCVRYFTGV